MTDVDCRELHVVMKAVQDFLKVSNLINKGHFERFSVQNWQKLASVHELKQFFCWKTPWK